MTTHLKDYVLHDVDGKCVEVAGTACGLGVPDSEWETWMWDEIWWNVFPKTETVTCRNCIRTKDYQWAADHPCCTAP